MWQRLLAAAGIGLVVGAVTGLIAAYFDFGGGVIGGMAGGISAAS